MPQQTDAMGFPIVGSTPPPTSNVDAMGFPVVGSSASKQPAAPVEQAPQPEQPSTDPMGFQVVGGTAPKTETPSDPNEPWYRKAWDAANKPVSESLGIPEYREGAGGFERGAEKILSGFTSPLSLGLTIATLGTGGFLESAGASVLKEAGLSVAEIADVAKGSEAALAAVKAGQPVAQAVKAAGVDPAFWKTGQDILYRSGLKEADLLGGNALERGASGLFRKAGLTASQSQTAAKTMQGMANAGFTFTQLQQAAEMSPRVLDALKEGDYDNAAEYATEALVSGGLGALGASHALHTAGELFEPAATKKLRPSDETVKMKKMFDLRGGAHEAANQEARLTEEQAMNDLGYKTPRQSPLMSKEAESSQNLRLAQIYHGITLGFDKNAAATHYNAIAEAAGREDRLPVAEAEGPRPENGRVYHGTEANFEGMPRTDGLGAHFTPDKATADKFAGDKGRTIEAELNIKNPLKVEDHGGSHTQAASTAKSLVEQKVLPKDLYNEDAVAERVMQKFDELKQSGASDDQAWAQSNNEELARIKQAIQAKGYDGLVYKNKVEGGGNAYVAFDDSQIRKPQPLSSSHPSLPDNLSDMVAQSDLKSKPKAYIDRLLDTYKGVYEGFNDTEMKVAQNLRNKLSEGFEKAQTAGLMGSGVEDYMTRVWKEQNPAANRVLADAKSGRFNTSVSQARHRVFSAELEPLLKGYEYASENPVGLTSNWLASVNKAIANRNLLDNLRDNFVRGSDGRPAVAMSGSGRVVEGTNGENPVSMINPNRMRDIAINKKVISSLQDSGELQRYLENGTIHDVTPKVRPDNIGQAIDRLEQKAQTNNPTYDVEGNNILRRDLQTLKDIQAGKRPVSDLDAINEAAKPVYVWRPQDYVTINNPAFRGWNFAVNDPSGNPIVTEADIKVHPEFADYLKARLGLDESGLQKFAPTKYLLKAGTKAKKTLLSLSPFHASQEFLRAIMTGISPFMKAAPTIENSPVLRKMVDNHLTLEPDYHAIQEHSEGVAGHSNLLSKIPGVGRTIANSLDWYEDFLFKRYIPNLKARAAELMFEKYEDAHPDWSKDKVAQVASAHVNDTFGGQNWKAMGVSAATQDWSRLMLLAPDWLASELRSGARLFNKDEGSIGRAQVAKMTMGLWGVSRVLNLLSTGKPHLEAPFGIAFKDDSGKETVYSIRTLPVDLLHAASDPTGFMKGRLNPLVRAGQEVYTGRDQFGRKLAPGEAWVDVFRNMAPLPLQAVGKAVSGTSPDLNNTDQAVKALGGTATVYKTQAQKLAAELASNHTEDGPVDQANLHRHQAIIKIEDAVRAGHAKLQDLQPLRMSGQLSESDYKKIVQNYAKTRGMTADAASLYTRAARAPASDLLQIWDKSTQGEKVVIQPLVIAAGHKYIVKALKNDTPEQRMSDPVLARFMKMQAKQQSAPVAQP